MTPGNILLYYIQCCAQPSLEELPPAVDGSEYRDPQTDNVQIVRDLEHSVLNKYLLLIPPLQGSENPVEEET